MLPCRRSRRRRGNPWAARQPARLGQIVISKIGLDQPFFEGVDQAAFAHGAGHWPGSAAPGGWGNAVFGGHRVTEAHPFLDMDKLRAGDEIDFVMQNGWTYVYRVTKVFVASQSAMWITDQSPGRTLTIFTCHPKWSSSERLVTSAVLSAWSRRHDVEGVATSGPKPIPAPVVAVWGAPSDSHARESFNGERQVA